jgi:hypothetical protein
VKVNFAEEEKEKKLDPFARTPKTAFLLTARQGDQMCL